MDLSQPLFEGQEPKPDQNMQDPVRMSEAVQNRVRRSAGTGDIRDNPIWQAQQRATQYAVDQFPVLAARDPDLAAAARQAGIDLDVAQLDRAQVLGFLGQRAFHQELLNASNPALGDAYSNPEFFAIAHDDAKNLNRVASLGNYWNSGKALTELGALGVEVARLNYEGKPVPDDLLQQIADANARLWAVPLRPRSLWDELTGEPMRIAGQWFGGAPTVLAATAAGAAVGSTLPGIGTAAGALTGLRAGFMASAVVSEGGNNYLSLVGADALGLTDDQALAMGIDPGLGVDPAHALMLSTGVGILNGALEFWGMSTATKLTRKAGGRLVQEAIRKKLAKDMLITPGMGKVIARAALGMGGSVASEALTEGMQEVVGWLSEEAGIALSPEGTLDLEGRPELLDRVADVMAQTIKGMLFLSLPGGVMSTASGFARLKHAEQTESYLNAQGERLAKTRLAQRDKRQAAGFVDASADQSDVKSVFINVADFDELLAQGVITLEDLTAAHPEIAQRLEEGRSTGVVELPLGTYGTAFLSSTSGSLLSKHIRLTPTGPTQAELAKLRKQDEEELVAQAEQVLEKHATDQRQWVEELTEVENDFVASAVDTGTLPKEQVSQAGKLYSAFVSVTADALGMTPLAYHKQYGIKSVDVLQELSDELEGDSAALEGDSAALEKQESVRQDQEEQASWRGSHRPPGPDYGAPGYDLTANIYPDDVYGADGPRIYGGGDLAMSRKTMAVLRAIRGKPDAKVTIYRAVPTKFAKNGINDGDWVTVNRDYAELHGEGPLEGDYVIIEKEVRADEIHTDGNALEEFGYNARGEALEHRVPHKKPPVKEVTIESANALGSTKKWGKNRDLKVALQDAIRKALSKAGIKITKLAPAKKGAKPTLQVIDSKEVEDFLVKAALNDALFALKQNPNAVGWYDLKTRQALAVVSLIHPELLTDENARFAFTYALAVTSNGLKVDKNFQLAEQAYLAYKKTGEMPTNIGIGNAAKAINNTLDAFNKMRREFGLERLRKLLLSSGKASVFENATGLKVSGEFKYTEVLGAAVLGPKIGNGFFANLYGMFDQLTMDRWLIRTWGRWTGTLLVERPDMVDEKSAELKAHIGKMRPATLAELNKMLGLDAKKASPEDLAVAIKKFSEKPENRSKLNKLPQGSKVRRAGNSLWKWIDGQKEAPSGPGERVLIRRVFARTLESLKADPSLADMTMADLQAVLWYAERRIYESSKEEQTETDADVGGYDDSEAPDYAVAASKLAKAAGVSDRKISNALKREEQQSNGRPGDAQRRAGESAAETAEQGSPTRGLAAKEFKHVTGHRAIAEARAARRGAEGASWRVTRTAASSVRRLRVLIGATPLAEWKLGQVLKNRLRELEINVDTGVFELDPSDPSSGVAFHAAISAYKKRKADHGASVFSYEPDEYSGMRLFLSEDKKSGVAVKPDGEIVSVFSGNGQGRVMMEVAIAAGGTKAYAFDIGLADLYAGHGLRVVARVKWDDSKAPEGWSKDYFSDFNGGEPDVVFMVVDPDYTSFYEVGDGGKPVSYETAVRRQTKAVKAAAPAVKEQASITLQDKVQQQVVASGRVMGRYQIQQRIIELSKDPNLTVETFVHELAHAFFFMRLDAVLSTPPEQRSPALKQMAEDLDTLLQWFGIEGATFDERVAKWNSMTLDQQRKHHEAWAESFTLYVTEGRAPTPALKKVFGKLRSFLVKVWKTLRRAKNQNHRDLFGEDLPIVTAPVREVMDRMLAVHEAVQKNHHNNAATAALQTKEEALAAGMTEQEWHDYKEAAEAADLDAEQDLGVLLDLKALWAKHAKREALRKYNRARQDAITKRANQIREDFADDINSVWAARQALSGSGDENKLNTELTRKAITEHVERVYAQQSPEWRKEKAAQIERRLGYGEKGALSPNGSSPEIVASLHGFETVDAMINALVKADDVEEGIRREAESQLIAEQHRLWEPGKADELVAKAIANEARKQFLLTELRLLLKSDAPVAALNQAAEHAAVKAISKRLHRTLTPHTLIQIEARASKALVEAVKSGDRKKILEAKSQQLTAHYLLREGLRVRDMLAARRRRVNKSVKRSETALSKTHDGSYVAAARALMGAAGEVSPSVMEKAQRHLEETKTNDEAAYAEIQAMLEDLPPVKSYKDMTVEEASAFFAAVESLMWRGEDVRHVELEGQRVLIEDAGAQLVDGISNRRPPGGYAETAETAAISKSDQRKNDLKSSRTSLTQVEHLLAYLDSHEEGGPWLSFVWDPVKDALNNYRNDQLVYLKQLTALLDRVRVKGKFRSEALNYTFGNGNGGLGLLELVGALLHSGNISNLERLLLGGRGEIKWGRIDPETNTLDRTQWDRAVEELIQNGYLTEEVMDVVQGVWDLMEKMKPVMQKAHRSLTGRFFLSVPADEITLTFQNGTTKTYRGGYVPASPDPDLSPEYREVPNREEAGNRFVQAMPKTPDGMTKERASSAPRRSLAINPNFIIRHIDESMRFAHVQPAVHQVVRILNRPEVRAAVTRYDPNFLKMMQEWLERVTQQSLVRPGHSKVLDMLMNFLRRNSGVAAMMLSPVNTLQQLTGISNSFAYVKTGYMANAFTTWMSGGLGDWIRERSQFMNERMSNQLFSQKADLQELVLDSGWVTQAHLWTTRHAYFLQGYVQNAVDSITWKAAYEQEMAEAPAEVQGEARERRARKHADRTVRLAQGSFDIEDVAAYQAGTPFHRTLMQFSGYYNTVLNQMGYRKNNALRAFLLTVALPSILSEAIGRTLYDKWDDDDEWGLADDTFYVTMWSQLRAVAAMVPVLGPAIVAPIDAWVQDRPVDDRPPASPAVTQGMRALKQLVLILTGEVDPNPAEWSQSQWRTITNMLTMAGIPVTPVYRIGETAVNVPSMFTPDREESR